MKKKLINDQYSRHFAFSPRNLLKYAYISLSELADRKPLKSKPSIQFLYGHFLFGDEIKGFHRQMDFLRNNFRIISYSDAVNLLKEGKIDDHYICFSFDDGILNTYRIAEAFAEWEISAMFFINPGITDKSDDKAFIARHCQEKINKKPLDFMDWDDVGQLVKWGHEIGNHNLNHENLGKIQKPEWQESVGKATEMLKSRIGEVRHFAWPYGLRSDISPEIFQFILDEGHVSIASAIRGQHFEKTDLDKNFILRDQVIFKEPVAAIPFFYKRNALQKINTRISS